MGAYSVQFWGIDLTEACEDIEETMPSISRNGYEDAAASERDFGELSEYIRHHKLGESHYDGGGFGQITYIGKTIEPSARGITVTDEDVAEVEGIIERIPEELKSAIIKVCGRLPEAKFHSVEGWG